MVKTEELLSQINTVLKDCSQVGNQYKSVVELTKNLNDSFKAAVHIMTNKLNKHDEMMKEIFKSLQKPGILDKTDLRKMKDLQNEVEINYKNMKEKVDLKAPEDIEYLKKRREDLVKKYKMIKNEFGLENYPQKDLADLIKEMNELYLKIQKWEKGEYNLVGNKNIKNSKSSNSEKFAIFIKSNKEIFPNPYPGYNFKESIMGKGYYFQDCDGIPSINGCKDGYELIPSGTTMCCKKKDNYFNSNLFLESTSGKFIKSETYKGEMQDYIWKKGPKGLGYYQDINLDSLNSRINLKSSKKPIFINSKIEFKDQKIPGYEFKIGEQGPGFYLSYKTTDGKTESCDSELPCKPGTKKIWTGLPGNIECCKSEKKIDFIASEKFKGDKDGYEFKAGGKGIGYYLKNLSMPKNTTSLSMSQTLKATSNGVRCNWDEKIYVGPDGKKQCIPNTDDFIPSDFKYNKIKPMYEFFPASGSRRAGYYKLCDEMPNENGECKITQKKKIVPKDGGVPCCIELTSSEKEQFRKVLSKKKNNNNNNDNNNNNRNRNNNNTKKKLMKDLLNSI